MARHCHIRPHRRAGVVGPTLLALALAVSGCISGDVPAAPADDAELVTGRTLFAANCVNCHGSDGGGGRGSKLNEGRLIERYPDPADQFAIVADGRRAMPSFAGKLTDAELDAVVRYTREIIAES
ncbi:MAG: cytochrome c [Acidimicrobiia bacterium]|nr:cytochrome c [Acidimicrobiia bacterium]